MASSGHFDPSQLYDGYKEVEVLDPSFAEGFHKGRKCFQHNNPRSSKFQNCFVGKKVFQHAGVPLSNIRQYLWSKKDGPFEKELPVSEAPTPNGTSGHSNWKPCGLLSLIQFLFLVLVTGSRWRAVERWTNVGGSIYFISRINNQGIVKRIRNISDSPTTLDVEGSYQLDSEEVEVVNPSIRHHSSTSPS
ncbi:hypothetical protein O181_008860 [Austropuccinia psidii MF-1]|uniref:Uncharacterized protein n=1 Tax=Austropuccinia psidii MF-1 TaxID=1389203 RepID=A0A9Q3BQ64_9BASI|nr:hypothetical protein [Austropuccinia psidii MF-1]